MEIEIQSSVAGAPPPERVRTLLNGIARILRGFRVQSPKSQAEVSVLFCGDRRMRALNRRYRRKDRSTDVLSFPGAEARFLGDIAISVPYASRQARRVGEPVSRELERLLLHGFLHLLGYDHENDDGEMAALEAKLRRRLGLGEAA